VLEAMVRGDAAVIMGADAKETDRAGEWASENELGQTQGCRVSETFPTNRGLAGETFDAGPLEEILHLDVMDTGFGQVPARAIQAPGILLYLGPRNIFHRDLQSWILLGPRA
jgi:hypothetical protein